MRVLRLAILIALVASEAQAQQRIPSVVRAAIEENRKACEPDKFATDTGFLTRRDVNADGIDDFILDYGKAACGDSTSYFCGSAGCVTQVFVSLPQGEYTKVLDETCGACDSSG
jgi:hypothetical protein